MLFPRLFKYMCDYVLYVHVSLSANFTNKREYYPQNIKISESEKTSVVTPLCNAVVHVYDAFCVTVLIIYTIVYTNNIY